jgi:hypothetical protein
MNDCRTETLKQWPDHALVLARSFTKREDLLNNFQKLLQRLQTEKVINASEAERSFKVFQKAFPLPVYESKAYGIGISSKETAHPSRIFMKTVNQNQLEAQKEMIHFFKGATLQASSRLENFLLTQDQMIAQVSGTLAGIDFILPEPDFSKPDQCPIQATMTRNAYLASLVLALKQAKVPTLTEAEIQKLTQLLPESHTLTQGEALTFDKAGSETKETGEIDFK